MFGWTDIKAWITSIFLKEGVYDGTRLPHPSRERKSKTSDQPIIVDRFQERFLNDPEWQDFDRKVRQAVSNIKWNLPPEE